MLISDLKLLLRFNTDSIFEEVSQTNMIKTGDSSISVLSNGGGYVMQNDQYLFGDGISSDGYSTDISSAMTLGFWLYPVSPGLAINPNNSLPTSIEMPLLDFTDIGSATSSVIKLTEHTSETGSNYLKVSMFNENYSASSEEYIPLTWHYFWIVYSENGLGIYIDGKQNSLQNENGSVPSSLSGSFLDLYINHSVEGYSWNLAKNYGIIDDIFVLNIANSNNSDIQRVINDGVKFLVDDIYTSTFVDKSSIYFNDPETITITSLIDDMSYVIAGRNDGKILRGSPLLWENRRSFSNLEEIDILGLSSSSQEDGFLKLVNETVRL